MSIPELKMKMKMKMTAANKIHRIVTLSLTAMFCLLSSSIAAAFAVPSISPVSFNFGNVAINETSPVETFTLKNNESSAVSITSVGFTVGTAYAFDPSTTCGTTVTTLAPTGQTGSTCIIGVTITPTVTGAQPAATLTIVTSVNTLNVTLKATGVNPVVVAPTSLTFAAQFEGTTSAAPKTVTVTNEQLVPLPITSASISGPNASDFGLAGSTCPFFPPNSLPAVPGNCGISVNFTPTGSGTRTATLNIVATVLGSAQTQTIPLKGSGNAPVTLTPNSITNFTAKVGTTSVAKTITLKNANPNVALHISNLQFSGDFEQTATTCPLAPAGLGGSGTTATCTISATFNPSIGGIRDGQLQVNDDAATSPQVLNLQGTGTSPLTILPTTLPFPAQVVGSTSATKTVTLTNNELEPETFGFTLASTLGVVDYTASSNCPGGVIAAKSSCYIYINFAPSSTTPTTRTATLTITDSAPGGSPLTVSLTGSATATNPPAAVSNVSPGAATPSGALVPVTITGNGFTHFSSSSVISFAETNAPAIACNITVSSVSALSPNQLNAMLTVGGAVYGSCNIKVVTPLSGGGNETASLKSAFIISDPTNTHTITGVTPAFGTQGQTLNVALAAVGTHFLQGTTYGNFGAGITINSLTITDATDAVANITISNTTLVGYRTITLATNGEIATSVLSLSGNPIFQIGPNNATLVSVSPNTAAQGATVPAPGMTLTATGTHFLQNATTVTIGGNVIVGNVQVTSPTTAVAQVAVPSGAPLGPQNVTVATGGEIATLNNGFTVTGATPALLSVSPSSGQQGQALNVVITGNSFTNFVAGQVQAEFDGNISSPTVTVNSPHQVTIPISIASDANVGGITANLISGPTGSTTLFPFTFTVTPSSASIVSVVPNSVPQGGQVTLAVTGLNTIWNQADTTAGFYPVPVPTPSVNLITINSTTSANLNISVPTNTPPGSYGFFMATGGQIVSSSIHVFANTPTLTMSPANGLLPSGPVANSFSVSFTGQFTHWGPTTLPVIAGEGVTLSGFTVTSPTSATATVRIAAAVNGTPTAVGPRLVTFTTGGEIVTTYFNVTSTPVEIISVTPYHGPQSVTQDVEIIGLNTHFTSGVTQVLFGPQITVNSVTVNSAADLVANITTSYMNAGTLTATPPGWQQVYVNTELTPTSTEQLIAGFLVDAPAAPSILSVFPPSAPQGATVQVTITGSQTNWVQGTTEAILGSGVSVSNLIINSPTSATATLAVFPTAPVGGNSVIMITGSEIASGTGFSVTPSPASIVSVGPNVTCNPALANILPGCGGGSGGSSAPPYVVAQLQTTSLNIVGLGTHWLQGETTMSFGPGVVVDALTVSSPTTAAVQITVLSSAPVGFATLTTFTDGEVVSLPQAIDIEEGVPELLAISPTAAQQGASLTVEILGRFTHFNQTTTNAAFNQEFPGDIVVSSINVIDSQTMTANITVSPLSYVDFTPACSHTLTITTGSEQVGGLPGLFCIAQGAEEIINVTPTELGQGSTFPITITGSATNFVQGETQVSFGDPNFAVGQIQVNSATSLTVPVAVSMSATNGFKTVTVTTLGQVASQQYGFSVLPTVATLNEAIPNQAEQGAGAPLSPSPAPFVRLLAQYSHFSSSTTATFGAGIAVQSVAFVSATEVDATIVIDPLAYTGGRVLTVTTPNVSCAFQPSTPATNVTYVGCTPGSSAGTGSEVITASVFTIIPGPAIITAVKPNTGNEGQEVVFTVAGANTHWQQNFTQFYMAGVGSDLTVNSVVINSPTSALVDLSISPTATAGARSIYMVTNGESLTDSGAFVVTGGIPVITYLSPNNGLVGSTGLEVVINGNAYTQWDVTSVPTFGPGITVESFQVDDSSHIEAVIDIDPAAQLGYRTVVVQTGAQGLTSNFLVTAPAPPPTPYIWLLSPSSALPGQTLTVTFFGAYTHWDPGTGPACGQTGTTLTGFNAAVTVNCFQITSPTTATANITVNPAATASVSDLTLTTNSVVPQEVDNAQFSVVLAQPVLSIVDPGSAIQGAKNITVNILGQYTTFDNTTTFTFGPGITTNGPPTIIGPTIATQMISIDQLAPLGGSSVVANTPDATNPLDVTVSGAGFTVTPSLALISAVNPNTGLQGQAYNSVAIIGQNTHWDSSTVFSFGAGITVSNVSVTDATDATVSLTIPPLAPEGPTGATARTGGEVASLANAFVVQAGTPLLLSSGPGSVPQQGAVVFTILSQATTWVSNPPTVSYGPGITLTNMYVTSDTSLTVDGYVSPYTYVGPYNLTVTSGSQVLGIPNAVYVAPGPAVVNDLVPATGGQGQTLPAVQINGTNTNWEQGVTQLSFPGIIINSFTVNAPNSITANITVSPSAPAGEVSVTAITLGETATGVNVFTVVQTQPELLSVVSGSGAQGQTETVNLTADFTNFVNGTTTANFGPGVTVNSVTVTSSTTAQANITVQPTAVLGARNVSVTTGAQVVSLTNAFHVTVGPAAIAGLSPASAAQGSTATVTVTGSQTNFASGLTSAAFGGGITVTGITVNSALSATVSISIPNTTALGAYNVTLTTGGEVATILGGFTVTTGNPQLIAVTPPTGNQGATNLSVTLTGLFTNFVNGTSVASFGSSDITVNSTTVTSATTAVANINISLSAVLGLRNVTVNTGGVVASITGGFSVLAAGPSAVLNPGSAQQGTSETILITGTNTNFASNTTVNFGNDITSGAVTVNSPTSASVPITIDNVAALGARSVTITTGAQVATGTFTVIAGTPQVTLINPNTIQPTQSESVTVTGVFTNWVNGTTLANFGPGIAVGGAPAGTFGPVTVNNATTLTANLVTAGAPTGFTTVQIQTGAQTLTVNDGMYVATCTSTAPTVLSISPANAATNVPLNSKVQIQFSVPMNRSTFSLGNTSGTTVYFHDTTTNEEVPGTITLDASGTIATIAPTGLLAAGRSFQVYLSYEDYVQDACGTDLNSAAYDFTTAFTSTMSGPTLTGTSPVNGDLSIPLKGNATGGTPVVLQFSTAIDPITVQNGFSMATGGTPVSGNFTFSVDNDTVTFTPVSALTASATYTVSYSTVITDTTGTPLTNPGSFSFTAGTSAVTTGPSVTLADPANGTYGVGLNVMPHITFSEPINGLTIPSNLVLYNQVDSPYPNIVVPITVTVAANRLSATIVPSAPLLPEGSYQLYLCGYTDIAGNNGNCFSANFWTGTSSVTSPVTVATITPGNGQTGVPLNAQVVALMSNEIDPTSVTNRAITVTPSGGSAIGGTVTLASDGVTLTFVPTVALTATTAYSVSVGGFNDIDGNAVGGFTPTSFTTGTGSYASGSFTVFSTIPGNTATGISVTSPVTFTMTNLIDAASVNNNTVLVYDDTIGAYVAGSFAVNGKSVIFTPLTPYPPNTQMLIGVQNLKDEAGNSDTQYWYNFTTANTPDTTSPTVTILPANGATNVGLNAQVVLTFSKSINPSTITPTTLALFNGDTPISYSSTMSVDNRTIVINGGGAAWVSGATITVELSNGIQDLSGNALAPVSSQFTLSTELDGTAPSVVSMRPGNGATDVSASTVVTLFVSAPMNASTIAGALNVTDNGVPINGSVQLFSNGQAIEFQPAITLNPGDLIQVFLSPAAQSSSGTPLTNFAGSFTIAGSLATSTAVVTAVNPLPSATGVPLNAVIQVQYNQPLLASTVTCNGNLGSVRLYEYATGISLTPTCTVSGGVITITPTALLAGSQYQVYVDYSTNVTNTDGVAVQQYSFNFTAGTAADNAAPTIISEAPTNNASNIGTNAALSVSFSKAINPITVTGSTMKLTAGATTEVPSTISFSNDNTRVSIVPQAPLPASTQVTVAINGVTSQSGVALTVPNTVFNTMASPDFTPPFVTNTSVTSGQTNVPINSSFSMTFNKPMDIGTLAANVNNVNVWDSAFGNGIPEIITWSADQTTLYFAPSSLLVVGHSYGLESYGLTDLDGNVQQGFDVIFTTSFVSNPTVPAVVDTNPENTEGAVPVNATAQILFNEPINPASISQITLTNGGTPVAFTPSFTDANQLLVLTPTLPLAPGASYLLTITGVADTAGNGMTVPVPVTFTTGPTFDLVHPSVTLADPPNGTTGVGTNVHPHVVFSERLNPLSVVTSSHELYNDGSIMLYNNATSLWVPITVSMSADRLTATIVPTSPLQPNTSYEIYVGNEGVSYYDVAGNTGVGFDSTFLTGSSSDTTSATVTTISPSSGQTGVPLNTQVVAVMSDSIDPTTVTNSSITVTPSGGSAIAGTVTLAADGVTLTFTPAAALTASITYNVSVGGFKDVQANTVTTFPSSFTTGTVSAGSGSFTVLSTSPLSPSIGISVTSPITITMSNPINPASVNSSTVLVYDDTAGQYVAGSFAVSGNSVTFTPLTPYPANAEMYFGVQNLKDEAGNVDNQYWYMFTTANTADTTPPTVTISPTNGTTNAGLNTAVVLTFSKSINPTTITASSVNILNGETPVNPSTSISGDNRTVVLNYNNTVLPAGATLTVTATSLITDLSGNALANTTSQFTTMPAVSTSAPTVINMRPGNGATNVPTTTAITLFTSTPMNASTLPGALHVSQNGVIITGTVTVSSNGQSIEFGNASLIAGATIQVFLDSTAQDVYGNNLSSFSGQFTIAGSPTNTTAAVQTVNPFPGATGVPLNTLIQVEYNQPVLASTVTCNGELGSVRLYQYSTATALSPTCTVSGGVITINPGTLVAGSQYQVYVDYNTNVTNVDGLAVQAYVYNFTAGSVADNAAPTILTLAPPNLAQNIGTNAGISVNFNKAINPVSVNGNSIEAVGDGQTTVPSSISFTTDYKRTMITPQAPLPPGQVMTIEINGVTSQAGVAVTSQNTTFKTSAGADFVGPYVVNASVASGQTVGTNAVFAMQFDEPIDPGSVNPGGVNTDVYLYNNSTGVYLSPTISYSADLTTIFLVPPSLTAGQYYQLGAYYVTDLSGNAESPNFGVNFYAGTGAVTTGPVVQLVSPPSGSTGVPINAPVAILFNEPISGASVAGVTLTQGGTVVPTTTTLYDGDEGIELQPLVPLAPGTVYTINVSGVVDITGNAQSSFSSQSFTTGTGIDLVTPTIVSANITDNESNVPDNTTIQVVFSEPMDPSSFDSNTSFRLYDDGTGQVAPASVTFSANYTTVTLQPTTNLTAGGVLYYMYIGYSSPYLYDLGGNRLPGTYIYFYSH
jgi:hypothetical protein